MLSRMSASARWPPFFAGVVVRPGVPAPGQLLDRSRRRPSGSADGRRASACSGRGTPRSVAIELPHNGAFRVRARTLDVLEHLLLGLRQRGRRRDRVEQAGAGVHRPGRRRPCRRASASVAMTMSRPSSSRLSSASVTRRGDLDQHVGWRSRPVISQSIQTKGGFTGHSLGKGLADPAQAPHSLARWRG